MTAYQLDLPNSLARRSPDVFVVRPHKDNTILGRELIYTAVTRAKRRAEIWLPPDPDDKLFSQWVTRATDRHSGLVDALRA